MMNVRKVVIIVIIIEIIIIILVIAGLTINEYIHWTKYRTTPAYQWNVLS